MAHPDDCEILAYGTLALLAKKGWKIHIVSMSPGDCGSMEQGPIEIAATRRAENVKAAKMIGATYHCAESRYLHIFFEANAVDRVLSLTRSIAPTLMFTHSLVDYTMDHEETAKIARRVSFGYSIPNTCTGPIAKGSMVPWLYYADPLEGVDPYGNPIAPTTYVNTGSTMTVKANALKAHASQRDWLQKHHGMDQYITSMKHWSSIRGKEIGTRYAEGFRQHKGHPYPQDCILQRELGDLVVHS